MSARWSGIIGHVNKWTDDGRILEGLSYDMPIPLRARDGYDDQTIGSVEAVRIEDSGIIRGTGAILDNYAYLLPCAVGIDLASSGTVAAGDGRLRIIRGRLLAVMAYTNASRTPAWPDCRIDLIKHPLANVDDGGVYPDGTGGHTHAPASKAAAVKQEAVRGPRQQQIHHYLTGCGFHGATWREIDEALNLGHSVISGALTRLHRAGHVSRLVDQREDCHVYVLAGWEGWRSQIPYQPQVGATITQAITVTEDEITDLVIQLRAKWPLEQAIITKFLTDRGITVNKEDQHDH